MRRTKTKPNCIFHGIEWRNVQQQVIERFANGFLVGSPPPPPLSSTLALPSLVSTKLHYTWVFGRSIRLCVRVSGTNTCADDHFHFNQNFTISFNMLCFFVIIYSSFHVFTFVHSLFPLHSSISVCVRCACWRRSNACEKPTMQ